MLSVGMLALVAEDSVAKRLGAMLSAIKVKRECMYFCMVCMLVDLGFRIENEKL